MLGKVLGEISIVLTTIDDFVWGIPLIVLILSVGIYLTIRLKGLQITKMPMAIRHIRDNEKTGEHGEVSSFGRFVRHCPQPSEPVILSVLQQRW